MCVCDLSSSQFDVGSPSHRLTPRVRPAQTFPIDSRAVPEGSSLQTVSGQQLVFPRWRDSPEDWRPPLGESLVLCAGISAHSQTPTLCAFCSATALHRRQHRERAGRETKSSSSCRSAALALPVQHGRLDVIAVAVHPPKCFCGPRSHAAVTPCELGAYSCSGMGGSGPSAHTSILLPIISCPRWRRTKP